MDNDLTKKPAGSAVVPPVTDTGMGAPAPVQTPSDVPGMTPSPVTPADGTVVDDNSTAGEHAPEMPATPGAANEKPPVSGSVPPVAETPGGSLPGTPTTGLPPLNTPPTDGTTGDGTT